MVSREAETAALWGEVRFLLHSADAFAPSALLEAGSPSRFPPLKICMYCGLADPPKGLVRFGNEHIIPFGLGGKDVLPEACCKDCERTINKEIETPILAQQYGDIRAKLNMPTRNPRRRRFFKTVRTKFGTSLDVPLQNFPVLIPIYDFGTAGSLGGRPVDKDKISKIGWDLRINADDKGEASMRASYPDWDGNHQVHLRPFEFARFVAKVAHASAVAHLGYGSFRPVLPSIILSDKISPLRYIGGGMDGYKHTVRTDRRCQPHLIYRQISEKFDLVLDVEVFGDEGFPRYHALVGEIDTKTFQHMFNLRQSLFKGKIARGASSSE